VDFLLSLDLQIQLYSSISNFTKSLLSNLDIDNNLNKNIIILR